MVKEKTIEDVTSKEVLKNNNTLMVYNDDVNSFEHVINCFIRYLKHEPTQAEQCALIIHYKGKCDVKSGTFEELENPCLALLDEGLSAKIE